MSLELNIMTLGPMANATVTLWAGTLKPGQRVQNVNDFNPRTYIQHAVVGSVQVHIDLGDPVPDFDGLFVYLKNYKKYYAGSIDRYWSDDNVDWNFASGGFPLSESQNQGVRTSDWTAEGGLVGHRYYRLSFHTETSGNPDAEQAQVAIVGMYKLHNLARSYELPDLSGHKFHNRKSVGPAGQAIVSAASKQAVETFPRQYKILGRSNVNVLRDAHLDSGGSLRPCIIWDDPTDIDGRRLVRFADDAFTLSGKAVDYFTPRIRFEGVPLIASGEVY